MAKEYFEVAPGKAEGFEQTVELFRGVEPGESVRFECTVGDYRLGMTVVGDRGEIIVHHAHYPSDITTIDNLHHYLTTEFQESRASADNMQVISRAGAEKPLAADALYAELQKARDQLTELRDQQFVQDVLDADDLEDVNEYDEGIKVGKNNNVMRQRKFDPDYYITTNSIDVSGNKSEAKETINRIAALFAYDYDPEDELNQDRTWSGSPRPTDLTPDQWLARSRAMNLNLRGFRFNITRKPLQGVRPGMNVEDAELAGRAMVNQVEIELNLSARKRAVGEQRAVAEMRALVGIFNGISNSSSNDLTDTIKGTLAAGGIEAGRARLRILDSSGENGKELVVIDRPTMKDADITAELQFRGAIAAD